MDTTAAWVITLSLERHAALRRTFLQKTVIIKRNVAADEYINDVCSPAYEVENLLGEVLFFYSGDYEEARTVAEQDGYRVLAQTILPLGASVH